MPDHAERLTPMGVMVLSLLAEGDMHPYEMIRLMRQRRDDRFVAITNGTMYHTVARLQKAGLVDEVGVDRQGNRPERTTYALTDAGRDAAQSWVRRELERTDRPAEFRIALAEAHNLPRDEVVDRLRTRRAGLADTLIWYRGGRRGALDREVPEQFLVELEREAALVEADLQWLDGFVERLERRDYAWGVDELPLHSERYLLDRKAARL